MLKRENMEYGNMDSIWQTVVVVETDSLKTVTEPSAQRFQKPLRRIRRLRLGLRPRRCVNSLCCGGLPRLGEKRAPRWRAVGVRMMDLVGLIQQPKRALTAVGAGEVNYRDRPSCLLPYFLRFTNS